MEINSALQNLLYALVSFLIVVATNFVNQKAAEAKLKAKTNKEMYTISNLEKIIKDVVNGTGMEIAEKVKKAADDGKITMEEGLKIRDEAFDKVVSILGEDAMLILRERFGDVDTLIIEKIQSEVRAAKDTVTK